MKKVAVAMRGGVAKNDKEEDKHADM